MKESRSDHKIGGVADYASDVGVVGIFQILARLRGLILLPVIGRELGAAAYGVWTQSLLALSVGSAIINFQFPPAMVRLVSGTSSRSRKRAIFHPQLVVVAAFGVLVAIGIWLLPQTTAGLLFGDVHFAAIARWIGIWIVFAGIGSLALDLQRALHHVKLYGALNTGQILIQLAIVAAIILLRRNLELAVQGAIAWEAISAGVILLLGVREIGASWPGFQGLRPSLAISLPLIPSYFGGLILNYADRLIIAWLLGPAIVGVYAAAYALARVVGELYTPIQAALLPAAGRLWDKASPERGQRLLSDTLRYYLFLAIPAAGGVAILGPQILILLADQVASGASAWIILLLGVSYLMSNAQSVFGTFLLLLKDTRPLAVSKLISAAAYLVMLALAIPRWGLPGAAAATALAYGMDLTITFSMAWRRRRFALPLIQIAKAGLATIAMLPAVLAVPQQGLRGLVASLTAGLLVYFGVMILIGGVGKRELGLLRSILWPNAAGSPAPEKQIDDGSDR
jgi:O-antigen/teichoic acid export membrane protein